MLNQWGSVRSPRGLSFLVVYAVFMLLHKNRSEDLAPNPGVFFLFVIVTVYVGRHTQQKRGLQPVTNTVLGRQLERRAGQQISTKNRCTSMQVQGQIANSVSR